MSSSSYLCNYYYKIYISTGMLYLKRQVQNMDWTNIFNFFIHDNLILHGIEYIVIVFSKSITSVPISHICNISFKHFLLLQLFNIINNLLSDRWFSNSYNIICWSILIMAALNFL